MLSLDKLGAAAVITAIAGLAGACKSEPPAAEPQASPANKPEVAPEPPPAPVVHRHASSEGGILANAYLVEGADGVVAIDATLTVSEARALRQRLDGLGKPLQAVLLTHGHPDHYNGVAILIEGLEVPVLATAGVTEVIKRDDAAKEAQWKPMFGDEWPATRAFPGRAVADGERVRFGTLEFTVHEVGAAESDHDSYWLLEGPERAAFIGDLAFNQVHAYVSDGHTAAWIESLDRLEQALDGVPVIYPGHGAPGTTEMLAAQRRYLEAYRGAVGRLATGKKPLSDRDKAELTRVMNEHLGSQQLEFLIGLGADAVAAELAAN
jgi:glyoxylase-like metal-dependent hydrolase (beta-lactamase superfamily II)